MNCHICKKEQHASLLEYPRIGGICEKCATRLVTGWLKQNVSEVKKILSGGIEIQHDFQSFVKLNPVWVREKLGIEEECFINVEHKKSSFLAEKNEALVERGVSVPFFL